MKKQTTKLLSLMLISAMLSTFLIGIVAAQANPLLDPVKKCLQNGEKEI